jgi:hypothetical protein
MYSLSVVCRRINHCHPAWFVAGKARKYRNDEGGAAGYNRSEWNVSY